VARAQAITDYLDRADTTLLRLNLLWLDFARQVEDSGIDVLLLRDHFSAGAFGQQPAPFSGPRK
jgi:hypothetical protein